MKSSYKKSTLYIFIFLVLFAICTFISCLFLYFHERDLMNRNATIVFAFSDNSSKLLLDSSMPITDVVGRQLNFTPNQIKHGYSEFSISSSMEQMDSINYEIYAKSIGVAAELPTDYVKIYLTDADTDQPLSGYEGDVVPTYHDLKVSSFDPAGKKIYGGILKNGESENFRLRLWLADTYPITSEIRSFGILLYVKVVK